MVLACSRKLYYESYIPQHLRLCSSLNSVSLFLFTFFSRVFHHVFNFRNIPASRKHWLIRLNKKQYNLGFSIASSWNFQQQKETTQRLLKTLHKLFVETIETLIPNKFKERRQKNTIHMDILLVLKTRQLAWAQPILIPEIDVNNRTILT